MAARVDLADRGTPFIAAEVELMAAGHLRARGHFITITDDMESGEIIAVPGEENEVFFPLTRVKSVIHDV
jgi:hypothetical protein